ncbi:MAG: phosphoglycerate dehydrogenase [Anaerolineae bacterium]
MKVLIGPSSFGRGGSQPLDLLRERGYQVVMNPYGRQLTADEVVNLGQGCMGIIAGLEPLTTEVIAQLPDLRCISRSGVGLGNVDLDAARAGGIVVCNTPEAPTRAVAELTLGLIIALLRRFPLADRNLRAGVWQKETGSLLLGRTVGIVGLGRIGRMVAEMLMALGCIVCGADPYPDWEWLAQHSIELLELAALLRRSDVVSLHAALPAGSKPLIAAPELALMKRSAAFLNLARGYAVDEEALYEALAEGRIAGAALDVFVEEPYHGRLAELDNVILTPHIGSNTQETKLAMETKAVRNLLDALGGNGD